MSFAPRAAIDVIAVDKATLQLAAQALQEGKLVAFPTETVYGLGALHTHKGAVERIFAAKGRPANHPLVLHVDSTEMARSLVGAWPAEAQTLADAFWPGPLTLVLPRAAHVSHLVTGGLDTVAVRVPDSPIALALIRAAGDAIAAPSANPYQGLSPTTAEHVRRGLGSKVDMILDGGPCTRGLESTIVDVLSQTLLRLGPISPKQLHHALPELDVAPSLRVADSESVHLAPGMDAKHYAPTARLRVMATSALENNMHHTDNAQVMVLAYSIDVGEGLGLRLSDRAEDYGALLYAALHALDLTGISEIWVEQVPSSPAWDTVRDRLARAAHHTT